MTRDEQLISRARELVQGRRPVTPEDRARLRKALAESRIAGISNGVVLELLDALDAAEARIAAVEALARGWLALPHGHYGPATAIVRDRARDVLNAIGIEEGT